MADIVLDIEVRGKKELKAAANEFMRAGEVSRRLAADYSAVAAKNKRLVDETRRLEAVKKKLNTAVKDEIISRGQATRALDEEMRKSKEKILTDKILIDQEKKRIKLLEEDAKRTSKLVKAYAPARVAAAAYKKQILEIKTAQKQKIITDKEAKESLSQLEREFRQFTAGVATGGNQFARFNVDSYKSIQKFKRNMSVGFQQAGYQVGDFIVQVQSGQSVLVAIGQQGSQLAGIFGPTGAVVGAFVAAATAFGMIAIAASKAKKSMTGMQDLSKSFAPATKTMTDAIKNQHMEIFKLTRGIDDQNEAIGKQALQYQKALQTANEYLSSQEKDNRSGLQRIRANGLKILGFQLVKSDKQRVEQLEKQNEIYKKLKSQADALQKREEKRKKFLEDQLELKQKILDAEKDLDEAGDDAGRKAIIAIANEEDKLAILRERASGLLSEKQIQKLVDEQAIKDLKAKLRIQLLNTENADALIARSVSLLEEEQKITAELKEQERVRARQAKIGNKAILGMTDEEYQYHLNMQAYVEGRVSAPDKASKSKAPPKTRKAPKDPLQELMKNLTLQERLLGVEEDRAAVMKALGESYSKYTPEQIDSAIELTEYIRKQNEALKAQQDELDRIEDQAKQLAAPFDDFFMALVDGTTSAKDAFRSMATDIIQQLYRILVVQELVGSISGAIQGYMAGPVQGPNLPVDSLDGGGYTGSGPRSGGLDGKGGFMAMLHPRETVVDHTKGQSAGGTVVNQVFNISANTSDDTKRLITQTIAQASPAIINQSVGAVMNQRRRGGAMKSAFG